MYAGQGVIVCDAYTPGCMFVYTRVYVCVHQGVVVRSRSRWKPAVWRYDESTKTRHEFISAGVRCPPGAARASDEWYGSWRHSDAGMYGDKV